MKEQMTGALLGVAIGDALGVPVEFLPRDTYPPVTDMQGYGTYNKPPGTWSDDSSMTFCLAESLCSGFNIEDMKEKFCDWLYDGYWTHDGKDAFDVGITTSAVLVSIKAGTAPVESGESDQSSNGNGSLMRILPLVFYVKDMDAPTRFVHIEAASGVTHAHLRSKIACSIYVEMALQLLKGKTIQAAYEAMKPIIIEHYFPTKEEKEWVHFERILQDDVGQLHRDEVKSSGYVIDTLEASLWCLLTTNTFQDAVLTAVNLGEDTDTVGAVTGGLAGLHYGVESMSSTWLEVLARKEDIEDLCERFSKSFL